MLIIPYVCAEFHDFSGNTLFRTTPAMRGILTEASDAIKQDILFDMLVADGSIKVPQNEAQKKTLELDPMVGVTAEGKSAVIENTETGKPAKGGKTGKKEVKPEDKSGEPVPSDTEKKE